MKRLTPKKKTVLSVVSVVLVASLMTGFLTLVAGAAEMRSLEYVEQLKSNYNGTSLKILELAPSDDDGIIGYYSAQSEPTSDWKERAAMYPSKARRESYVNDEVFDALENAGLLNDNTTKRDAPLTKMADYEESYPWQLVNDIHNDASDYEDRGYSLLELDAGETNMVTGNMREAEEGEYGEYNVVYDYQPAINRNHNYFVINDWQATLGKTLREKYSASFDTKKFNVSKVLKTSKTTSEITVFGSTEDNWDTVGADTTALYYDLSTAYSDRDYYSINVEPGNTYALTFDVTAEKGKAQFLVIPYDDSGKNVFFTPNYSKQSYYQSAYVNSGHYEYEFSVPANSNVKSVQIRFDISSLETSAVFSNIAVYRFNQNLFPGFNSNWHKPALEFKVQNPGVFSVKSTASENWIRAALSYDIEAINCEANTVYTFTYHVELGPGGGQSGVKIIGNRSGALRPLNDSNDIFRGNSGTYFFTFSSGNNTKLYLDFGAKRNGAAQEAVFSNISLTKSEDYDFDENEATHIQLIDHFSTGEPGYTMGTNIFSYSQWYNSGSDAELAGSTGTVLADGANSSLTIVGSAATNYTSAYKTADKIYYVPVEENQSYSLSYSVDTANPYRIILVQCDENKNAISTIRKDMPAPVAGDGGHYADETYSFSTNKDCRWLQVAFGNTGSEQRTTVYNIELCKSERSKVYYYNLLFDPVTISRSTETGQLEIRDVNNNTLEDGVALYEANFRAAGEKGSFDYDPSLTYYVFVGDGKYSPVEDYESVSNGTRLYLPVGLFNWVGNWNDYESAGKVGSRGFRFDPHKTYYTYDFNTETYIAVTDTSALSADTEVYTATEISLNQDVSYYTSRINYNEYGLVTDQSLYGNGTIVYTYGESGYEYAGTISDSFKLNPNVDYFVKTFPVSSTYDANHPYWAPAKDSDGNFLFKPAEDDEIPLFAQILDGYEFMGYDNEGHGKGEYLFIKDENSQIKILTAQVFFKGGYQNNEWFKRYVMDCDDNHLEDFGIAVVTVTPEYLNSLSEKELNEFVQGFEMFVLTYGGIDGNAVYTEDISADVKAAIIKEAQDQEYPIPVMVDSALLTLSYKDKEGNPIVNIPGLAATLTSEVTASGGVSRYTYKYSGKDIGNPLSPASKNFVEGMKSTLYSSQASPYYSVLKELNYENFIREANKNKYQLFDEVVTEAACIRYILNFRGQRPQSFKDTIRILEIQPYTSKSQLKDSDGEVLQSVKDWFGCYGNAIYVDEDTGKTHEVTINIDTMATGELVAKNDSITEEYDMIYVGASLENLKTLTDPDGHIIPDYEDDAMEGMYYTSTGDKIKTGSSNLLGRASLAGLSGTDYTALRHVLNFKILGITVNLGSLIEDSWADAWWVDASDCELRMSGNDITEKIGDQIMDFAATGKPIVYADELVKNEYIGTFSAKLTGEITGWADSGSKAILRFRAELLFPNGSKLPAGAYPTFDWYGAKGKLADSKKYASNITYADEDGDGVKEVSYFTFTFKEGDDVCGYGDYYCNIGFAFTGVKYKGLQHVTIRTNSINYYYNDVRYRLYFDGYSKPGSGSEAIAWFELLTPESEGGFMPSFDPATAPGGITDAYRRVFYPGNFPANTQYNKIFKFKWYSTNPVGDYNSVDYIKNISYERTTTPTGNPVIKTVFQTTKTRYYWKCELYIDDRDPSYAVNSALIGSKTSDEDIVRYMVFTDKGGAETKTTEAGIELLDERFDTCSYMYITQKCVFGMGKQIMSNMQLNTDKGNYRYNLLRYCNLSAPEIVTDEDEMDRIEFPNILQNNKLEFSFSIKNNTDDTPITTRYSYKFFVDSNHDGKFSDAGENEALVDEVTNVDIMGTDVIHGLRGSSGDVSYTYKLVKQFPSSASGIIPWKLVITKIGDDITATGIHDSITGFAYIRPQSPTEINAIQILPNDWTAKYEPARNFGTKFGENEYKGSVFFSEVFQDPSVLNIGNGMTLRRKFIYAGSDEEVSVSNSLRGNDYYNAVYSRGVPTHIIFYVGNDFRLDISFTNIVDVTDSYSSSTTEPKGIDLSAYNMLILGFADNYGRALPEKDTGVIAGDQYTAGFGQNACKAIEKLIDSGVPTLFCHDTASHQVNFVSYWLNEALIGVTNVVDKVVDWFKNIFSHADPRASMHSSRVKQGYYTNIVLRDKLGQDRYGVTKNIKDNIVRKNSNIFSYSDIAYSDENLKDGHDYGSLYKVGDMAEVRGIQNLSDDRAKVQEYIDLGYSIAWVPNSNKLGDNYYNELLERYPGKRVSEIPLLDFYTNTAQMDVFYQGFSSYTISRFRQDDKGTTKTDRISQVNRGQITSYPYDVNVDNMFTDKLPISVTHEQAYQVSLCEKKDGSGTTVWYTLAPGTKSGGHDYSSNYGKFRNDATNAYYIYTHGNVTYTGAGHTNTFSVEEAQLFLNTLVAAYRVVADKPVINFTYEDGTPGLTHVMNVVSASYNDQAEGGYDFNYEAGTGWFKVKDTSTESENRKTLTVQFYRDVTEVRDEETGEITYTYKDSDEISSLFALEGDTALNQVKAGTVYEFKVPQQLCEELKDKPEMVIYAKVTSVSHGIGDSNKVVTTVSNPAKLDLRKMGLSILT